MKRIFSIPFALVLVVSLMAGSCVSPPPEFPGEEWIPAVHGEVSFMQLEWMASPEEALYPYSNVGAVEFTFEDDAGDWLLDQHGGGWLNVVIDTTAAGGDLQWAVQNLYLTYQNLDYLLGSTPSVQFSLGLDGETPIEGLEAAVFLSSEPLEEQPEAVELFPYMVIQTPYLVGGLDGGGSATWDLPLIIGPFIGPLAMPVRTESINITADNISAINEGHNKCASGAIARGISYLGKKWGFLTNNASQIYDYFAGALNFTGENYAQKILDAKDSYCANKGLNITSEIVFRTGVSGGNRTSNLSWNNLMTKVKDALKNRCAVEIWLGWRNVSGNYTGHMAMVTSVTDHADGKATIHYVDDPKQGNGVAENKARTIAANITGNYTGGTVYGFMIESFVGTPP